MGLEAGNEHHYTGGPEQWQPSPSPSIPAVFFGIIFLAGFFFFFLMLTSALLIHILGEITPLSSEGIQGSVGSIILVVNGILAGIGALYIGITYAAEERGKSSA